MTHRASAGRAESALLPLGSALRLLVTGSRDLANRQLVWRTLDEACAPLGARFPSAVTVVHGKHPSGADWFAHEWCEQKRCNAPVTEEPHPPSWLLGRKAGPIRNAGMVKSGADACLAYYQRGSANVGTDDCAGKAYAAGIPLTPYWSDEVPAPRFSATIRHVGLDLQATIPAVERHVRSRGYARMDAAARKAIGVATGLPAYSFYIDFTFDTRGHDES